jgi:hypothetical protein
MPIARLIARLNTFVIIKLTKTLFFYEVFMYICIVALLLQTFVILKILIYSYII